MCPDNVQVDHTEDIREDIDEGIDPLFERDLWGDAAYLSYAGAQQNKHCRNKVHSDLWANYSPSVGPPSSFLRASAREFTPGCPGYHELQSALELITNDSK